MTTSASASVYERLGGAAAIHAVVGGFYERVAADPELAPFFVDTAMGAQRRRLAAFVAAATGGPAYRGRSVREAHADLGITQAHFDAVAGHLVAELTAAGVDAELIDEVVALVAPLAGEVVTVRVARRSGDDRRQRSHGGHGAGHVDGEALAVADDETTVHHHVADVGAPAA